MVKSLGLMDPFVVAALPAGLGQLERRRSTLAISARLFMIRAAPRSTSPSLVPIGSCM